MTNRNPFVKQGGRYRTQNAAFLRSFSVVLFLLPLLFAGTAYGDINADLLEAVKAGNTSMVEQLLEQGADVNAKDKKYGVTALKWAARSGHTETVKALIDAGADVTKYGWDALQHAIGNSHTETVKALIEAGADVREDGDTLLQAVAGQGQTENVKVLIEAGADVNAKTPKGSTALMSAARKGHTETVKLLIEAGVNVNAESEDGDTALMFAAAEGHIEIVQILKRAGAQADTTADGDTKTDLYEAAMADNTALVEQLLQQKADLLEAAGNGNTAKVEQLLKQGADANAESEYGSTALSYAAGGGQTETVKVLIAAGADVNANAMMLPAIMGHTETVKALIDAGADVNAKDKNGRTALSLATQNSHTGIVNILKQAGAQTETTAYEVINAVLIGIVVLMVAVIIFGIAARRKIIGGRANREQFFLVFALNIVVAIIISVEQIFVLPEINYILLFLIFIIGQYFLMTIGIKRLHDFDESGWVYLLALVPIVNLGLLIGLLIAPGTNGANRYGQQSDTRKYRALKVVGFPVIGLFAGGITGLVIFALGATAGGADFGYALFFAPLAGMPFGITGAVIGLVIGLIIGAPKGKSVVPQ